MRITDGQLRQIIREELLREAGETDLNNYSISQSGTNAIKVFHKPTGVGGVSKRIQVDIVSSLYTGILDVASISNIRFYPNAPAGKPILFATVELDNKGPNVTKEVELKNRDAMLGIANAIINNKSDFKAPPGQIPGGTASLIINGKD